MRSSFRRKKAEHERSIQAGFNPDQMPTPSAVQEIAPQEPGQVSIVDVEDEFNPDDLYRDLGGGD